MPEEKELVKSEETTAIEEDGDPIDEKKLLRKLDWHLLPGLTFLFLLSFLDRSNVGNARIEGLAADTHMTGNQYLTTLTIYFAGYVLFEVPFNILLKLTSPRFWLPTLTLAWGIVCTLMGFTQNFSGFLVVRFFLGVAESGFFPGVVFYLSMWYKRNEQHYRIAMFVSSATLAGAFGGFLAFALAKMKGLGGLGGWRWIFIIEGLMTVVMSIAAYFFVYNYPTTAKFLTPREREYVIARLKGDSDATRNEKFTWAGVRHALADPKIYLYGLCYHTLSLPGYTLSLFLPSIINGLGYSATQAQLLSIPPYVAAFITTMSVAVIVEKTKRRAPFIIGSSTVGIIGYIVLITSRWPGVSYAGTIITAAGIFPAGAIVLSWPANNVSGQTKRATANAMQISIGNLGAVLGTQLYRPKWSPRHFVGHGTAMGYLVGNIIVVSILWYIMHSENKRRDRGERDDRLKDADEGVFLGDDDPRWRFQT
ncbi:MFS general substrate transporter [Thelephora ganbajun]|uniref:MFS general substrate transporter n=1 Tax=Thelephora ganbajun TaxID=370292 RepID=A0ACB6ZCC0_THEGA|nr:MFS general substrate transporter [Thelephora ganbajun]